MMTSRVVPLADLPVAWWGFWLVAAAAVFFALAWTLSRLAVAQDEREGHEGSEEVGQLGAAEPLGEGEPGERERSTP